MMEAALQFYRDRSNTPKKPIHGADVIVLPPESYSSQPAGQ